MEPLKKGESVNTEMAEAPNRSYSFAWVTGSTSIWIAPFEGEDRLISAMIFICVVPLIFFLKGMGSPGWLGVNLFPLKMATSFSFSLIILFKIVMLDYPAFCRSEEHTSELQSRGPLVCRLLLYI